MELLNDIKLILGITDTSKDALLNSLIEQARADARAYTHNDNFNLSSVITQMVVYKYRRLGTEGLDSENYSGVSFSYSSDYPDSIISILKSYRKVMTPKTQYTVKPNVYYNGEPHTMRLENEQQTED